MKIRGINLIIIFILAIINSFAFPKAIYAAWSRTYGGFNYDWAHSIQQTSDGGFIAAGGTDSFGAGSYDFWVVKLDSAGDIQWEKAYGGVNTEQAFYIQQTNDGGYIVIGFTDSFGAGNDDIWILKLDSSGNIQWQKAYGGANNDDGLSIKQTNDGGYIALGYTESFGAGLRDLWVLKLDANGDIIWQKTYGGSNNDEGNLIQQTNDGGYIIVGDTKSFGSGAMDLWVLKLDSAGSIQWQRLYGGSDDEWGIAISQTNDSDYIVAGSTRSFGSGLWDIWILKLDSSGAIQWQKTYGTSVSEEATFIQQTNDNGFIISGYYFAAGTNPLDYLILKLDQLGNTQWQKIYSGADWDFPFSIQQTGNGYIVAGITYSAGQASSDMWLLKLSIDGSINSSCSFIYDYSASVNSSSAIPINSNAIISDSAAAPTSTASIGIDTNAIVWEQCSTACSLQPLNNQKPLVNDDGSPTANNLFEPAETAELFSTLQNIGDDIASSIIGSLATDDPTININQPNASYPYLNPGSSGACTICYSLTPQAVRPATHWDFLVSDNISASECGPFIYDYTYHVGESFEDVPPTNLFYKYIEALLHYSLTGGCTSMSYCPSSEVERQQMAKFICLAMEAARQNSCLAMGCGGIFSDVSYTNIFCKFIEKLYYLGIVGGCQSNPMLYCPASFTDREAMAKFICLAMNNVSEGSCPTSFCTGIFADVSSNNIFCPYIEALYNIKIVGGCQSNPLLYCPYDNVSREQMAKYLINAFGLQL